jgi:hypothetical protein
MLASDIKALFFTRIDEFASAYWSNDKLNDLFFTAQTEVFEDLMDKYQLDNSITEAVLPLVKNETVNVGNEINVDTDLSEAYQRLITIQPTFTVNGKTYSYYAEQFSAEESNSVYAQGSVRYPRYDQYSNSNNERIIKLYPTNATVTSTAINYFRTFYTIDFARVPPLDIPYPNQTIEMIVNKALQIAAATTREDGFFQTENVIMQQGKTAHQ